MPKKMNRTQKKRRVKRGFKTRSQRGGLFGFFEDSNPSQPKQSWGDWFNNLMNNPNEIQSTPITQQSTPITQQSTPTYQQPDSTYQPEPAETQTTYPTQGGKRRRMKCKKHHRHTKYCK